jgi:hypothetical protein
MLTNFNLYEYLLLFLRVILFIILFVHLDNENLDPKNLLIVNALIGIIGLFLYRRHISLKLCKQIQFKKQTKSFDRFF